MTILKCKMCGGDMEISADKTFGTCEYCGSTMTLPKVNDEQRAAAFNRGNHFRRSGEFDKALAVYERIVAEDDTDAEAHWCCALCRFGIEYVEDPTTYEWLPTCHRASFDSFLEDVDYLAAVENSDGITKRQYQKDAAKIAEVQRGILATSQNAEPYDVFISYKELDKDGNRTRDSILAQDIYYQLTEQGRRVFFSRITLEDVPGTQYEPYIFAALNSAKVMIVVGTSAENLNAVWVKNEWSRYLSMMRKDRTKLLLPCYRDMDPYDLPEQLSVLMSYDMGKIGFIQDLIRGVNKVLDANKKPEPAPVKETVVVQQGGGTNVDVLLKRGYMALEDEEFNKADGFFEEVLNQNAECAEAYVGKLLAKEHEESFVAWVETKKQKYLSGSPQTYEACAENTEHINQKAQELSLEAYLRPKEIEKEYVFDRTYNSVLSSRLSQKEKQIKEISAERYLSRALQYATGDTKTLLENGLSQITAVLDKRISDAQAEDEASIARVKAAYKAHIAAADKKAEELNADAHNRQEQAYQNAVSKMRVAGDVPAYEKAKKALKGMNGYKDSNELVKKCEHEIDRISAAIHEKQRIEAEHKAEAERAEAARKAEIERIEKERAAKKRNKILAVVASLAVVCIAAFLVVTKVVIPNNQYNAAVALMDAGQYDDAIAAFNALNGYKDSEAQIENCYIGKYGEEKWNLIKNTNVGDTFTFGAYEQDNNISNGKETIEWIVLNKDGTSVLLISKYALDCQQYNTEYTHVTWENCSLRKWMNGTFLNNAFSAEEQEQIQNTNVSADENPLFSTNPGNATTDKVFLLSITEAWKYFSAESARQCKPTDYAVANGAYVNSDNGNCWWWLRSPGDRGNAAAVFNDGSVSYFGSQVDRSDDCVRPALWINLDS